MKNTARKLRKNRQMKEYARSSCRPVLNSPGVSNNSSVLHQFLDVKIQNRSCKFNHRLIGVAQ
jgi:hypothetical protein